MRVRRARLEDAEPYAAAFAEVAEKGEWILTEPPVDVAARAQRFRDGLGNDPSWVLESEDGRFAGVLNLHATRVPGVASLGMFVVAEMRGRGGGRALLTAACAYAKSSDLHKIELEVFPENGRAIALYAGAGFEVEGIRRRHYLRQDGSRRSAVLMALFPNG